MLSSGSKNLLLAKSGGIFSPKRNSSVIIPNDSVSIYAQARAALENVVSPKATGGLRNIDIHKVLDSKEEMSRYRTTIR